MQFRIRRSTFKNPKVTRHSRTRQSTRSTKIIWRGREAVATVIHSSSGRRRHFSGTIRHRHDTVRYDTVRYGTVLHSTIRFGYGVWYGTVQYSVQRSVGREMSQVKRLKQKHPVSAASRIFWRSVVRWRRRRGKSLVVGGDVLMQWIPWGLFGLENMETWSYRHMSFVQEKDNHQPVHQRNGEAI